MIRVFYGDNRVKATEEIRKILGDSYEVIEGTDLTPQDLPNIFWGTSLFGDKRSILIRDILSNKAIQDELPNYLDTPHNIIILESKLDKRSSIYKTLNKKIVLTEFIMPKNREAGLVFDIYNTAKRDSKKAIKMLDKIKSEQEPMMFLGLMVSQAIRDYSTHPSAKEKDALRKLSKLDIQLKSSKIEPWALIKSFLLRLS